MKYFSALIILVFVSCIGDDIIDDYVDAQIRIINPIDSIGVGEEYIFSDKYFNNIGKEVDVNPIWNSSNTEVMIIDNVGNATALKIGNTIISVIYEGVIDSILVTVTQENTNNAVNNRSGIISSTSSYLLEGSFQLKRSDDGNLILTLQDDFQTTSALPGLYVYIGNNDRDITNALEISKIKQFSGEHSYIIENAELFDFQYLLFWCKPFNVKVGEGNFE